MCVGPFLWQNIIKGIHLDDCFMYQLRSHPLQLLFLLQSAVTQITLHLGTWHVYLVKLKLLNISIL